MKLSSKGRYAVLAMVDIAKYAEDKPCKLSNVALRQNISLHFLEQIFLLMYYSGFSYRDAYNLPVWQRVWFIERINKEITKSQGQNRGHEAPQDRATQGKHRAFAPSNQRRFT